MPEIGYIGGTFDLFHAGHVELFWKAKNIVKTLVVGLNTDEFAKRYKRPTIMTLQERMKVVSSCRYVDRVIVNHGDEDSKPAILDSGARVVFHGDDWMGESLYSQMGLSKEWLVLNAIEMIYLPYTKGISSTDIEQRVLYANGAC